MDDDSIKLQALEHFLVSEYCQWINEKLEVKRVSTSEGKEFLKVSLPFLDSINDYIQIYIIIQNNMATLSDDSYTLSRVELSGVKFTKEVIDYMRKLVNHDGIFITDELEISLTVPVNETKSAMHVLLQAILSLQHMAKWSQMPKSINKRY